MSKQVHLISIDPQIDFCSPTGKLFVPKADEDMKRLAKFITKAGKKFADIHCTLDSHQIIHIAHPIFWQDSKSKHPNPFTEITVDDVQNGRWTTTNPAWQSRGLAYVEALKTNGRYKLMIWPPHCLIGSIGAALVPEVSDALIKWEQDNFGRVNYVAKGSNFFTEHYSAVQADVPDDNDNTTKLNTDLITIVSQADEILATGEALSHCMANTFTDIADNFGEDNIKKMVLLEDTTSSVTGCEKMGDDFIKAMMKRGMRVTKTTDW
jgi:nicotinamidase-related amidase